MAITFEVDGKTIESAGLKDISSGFASIDAEGPRGISVIRITREPVSLFAFGHPKEGYTLEIENKPNPRIARKATSLDKKIPHDEVVATFMAFARGDESWPVRFEWRELSGPLPTPVVVKRLAVYTAVFLVLILVAKYLLKLF